MRRFLPLALALASFLLFLPQQALAAAPPLPSGPSVSHALQTNPQITLLALLSILAILPGVVLLMTSFTRIVVVLSLLRTALGLNQVPPNQVIIGLSLFLTFFTMAPTLSRVETTALQPYLSGRINLSQAAARAQTPIKAYLARGTRQQDLAVFLHAENAPVPKTVQDVPLSALVPAYTISQLTLAFEMGVLLFVPFVIIDFIVASVLMALGMMMVPPTLISLPIKLLLFVLMDGWGLVVQTLLTSR
ncbi:MAG: flagellar type III secretion system pore protein FliP [Thermaerobacter sp.]|nr:flagellar type III secretion system pore protein FliP [Thermaerobacter sp.]